MAAGQLVFRVHALRRMAQRQIDVTEVREVLQAGEVIEEYPDDTPYPSRLILGFSGDRAFHVVTADAPAGDTIVITVYEPDPDQWDSGFRVRKKP